jgi:hypothetical protein
MRRILRILVVGTVVLAAVSGLMSFGVYRASQQVPEFYQEALDAAPEEQEQAGKELEQQIRELAKDVQNRRHWEASFSADQVNGWLASDLMRKYPLLVPKGVYRPRVAIDPEQFQLACKYSGKRMKSVITINIEIRLTDRPNVAEVRLKSVHAGALPVPLQTLLKGISKAADRSNLSLQWTQQGSDPIALITIPERHDEIDGLLRVDRIELRDGELYVAGHTDRSQDVAMQGTTNRHSLTN